MKPIDGRAVHARRPFGRFPAGIAPALILLGFLALASSGPYFPFFPLVPLFFVLVFFAAPAIRHSAVRGAAGSRGESVALPARDTKEKELLRALERHEGITAARAALETSLGVAEAEQMLARLASGGHVEVRARGGAIAYALRAADRPVDRRGATDGELGGGPEPPSESRPG